MTHKQPHGIKTRLLEEKMLDKVQTWHLPHLYSIRIQNYLSGHEISKQHIAFKQNARGNSDFNIKVVLVYTELNTKEKTKQKKKQTKETNSTYF